jgi:cytochrome bd-type quinol oxidase subunit 1
VIRVIGTALLLLSALLASGFVGLYAVTARWWRSEMGRDIMRLMMVIAGVLDLSAIRALIPATGGTLWFSILRLIVFAFVPVALGMRLWLLWKTQVQDRRLTRRRP